MDTATLIREFARERSEEAFARLVAAHIDFVYSVALRQGCDPNLAEDVAQIVFIQLARDAAKLRPDLPLEAWLFTVTRNAASNARRERDRRLHHERKAAAMKDTQTDPATANNPDLVTLALDDALAQLRETDRNLLILRYMRNLPLKEIGERLGLSENTAGKRIARAIEKLRAIMLRKGVAVPVAGITASLAGFGIVSAPKALAGAVAHSAILAAHSNIAATLGGWLMFTSKMKIAAIVAAIVLVVVPTSIVVVHWSMSPPIPSTPPSPRSSGPVEAQFAPPLNPLAYQPFYTLGPGQVLKPVDAPPEARRAMYQATHESSLNINVGDKAVVDIFPELNGPMIIEWDNDQPKLIRILPNVKDIPPNVFIQTELREFPQNLEGNVKSFGNLTFPGDLVIRKGATPDEYCQALQGIFQKDLKQNVTLSYREVSRSVIVLREQWNYQRIDTGIPKVNPLIQFYGTALDSDQNGGQNGYCSDTKDLAGYLGEWIQRSVIVEAAGIPGPVEWHGNFEENTLPGGNHKAHDLALVLDHVTEQTGLKWSEETRTVRHLFIEQTK